MHQDEHPVSLPASGPERPVQRPPDECTTDPASISGTSGMAPGAGAHPPDLTALLELILHRAMALIGAAGGAILLWDEAEQALLTQVWASQPVASRASRVRLGEGLSGMVAADRKGRIVNDYRHWPGARRAVIEKTPITASLAEPLVYQDRLVGVVNLHNGDTGRTFADRDGELLRLFADQAAIAIENARLFAAAQRDLEERRRAEEALTARTRQLEAIRAVSAEITRELDLDRLLDLIMRRAMELLKTRSATVFLWDEANQWLVPRAWSGLGDWFQEVRVRLGEGVVGVSARRREGMIVNDYRTSPYTLPFILERTDIATVMSEPLLYRDRLVGALVLRDKSDGTPFQAEDQQLLRLFADQAAIAIENARLHTAAVRREEQLEALLRASHSVMAGLDLQAVLEQIAQEAARIAGCQHVKLLLVDPEARVLRVGVLRGGTSGMASGFPLPVGAGLSGTVAETGKPLYIADTQNDPRSLLGKFDRAVGLRTYLGLPVRGRDEVLGVLTFNTEELREYSAEEVTYLQAFADQAAIAIENARLHATTVQRAEQLLTLNELSRSLTTTLEPQRVAREILRAVHVLLPDAVRELWTWDETAGRLSLVEIDGIRSDHPDIRYQFRSGEGLVGTAAATRQPAISRDVTTDHRVCNAAWAAAEGLVAGLALPLIHLNRLQGTLCILTRAPHEFTGEEMTLLQALADQAAIALENARLYQAVHQSFQDLQRAQEELLRTEKLRALGQLAAGIAHDLNNVLAAVLGQVELLKIRAAGPELREALAILETAAADGAGVVRRIQDFARQRPASDLSPCRLAQIVEEVVEITRPRWKDDAERRGLRIQIHTAVEGLPDILGNPGEIREALTNLIINAVEAMPAGGVISLQGATDGDAVLLTVRDSGTGMSAEVQAKIFEPFFTTKGVRGTGLGLSLVYGILERHGGRISADSAPGEGATFTLRFRRAQEEGSPPPTHRLPRLSLPRRILLVDDEDLVRRTLAALLRAVGAQVAEADGGAGALAHLREHPVDVVVTDLGMPDMTGWEVAQAVKTLHPSVPVVLVTGWQDQVAGGGEHDHQVDALLSKPARLEDLLRVLQEVTGGGAP
jgi:GAF domain-containing protein